MRLDGRLLLLFLVVSLVFGRVISVSSRSAVHAVLVGNLESPARAQSEEIRRSMDVGLRAGNEELLVEYLSGCLGGFGASYAAAFGPDGKVTAAHSAAGFAPAAGDVAEAGEFVLAGRPVRQLVFATRGGGLLLGYDLSEAARTEHDIALKIFLYTGLAGVFALVLLFLLMRDLVRRFDRMSADILDQMRDGVFVVDEEGKLRTVNPALLKMLGYVEFELTGRPASVLLAPGSGALGGPVENAELRLRRKDGGAVPVLLSVSLLREGGGGPMGIVCTVRDMTELKRKDAELKEREALLRRADKLSAVGRLAAGIAHEINNPLGSILGFAQAAAARLAPSEALSMPLRAIEEEALRCRTLVKSLLSFSRESRGALEEFELAAVVEGTLAMIEAQARVRGVLIARELEPGPRAVGDRGQIQQIVMNLCTNAIDAMPDGGTLTVRCGRAVPGTLFLEIQDQGTGIPEEIRGRIFDPFFTTKDVGQGTGLGLALVHEIVVRHRGSVSVSDAAGGGTLLRVDFPAAP